MKTVSAIIPTFRRPEGLDRAMASIKAQTGLSGTALDLIVCDNSPEASARAQVEAFALTTAFPVRYVHEPKTGVANARNAAVAATQADFIAFLDDDEEAPADWLWRMLANQAVFKADVVFGPVTARIPDDVAQYRPYFEAFFSRRGSDQSQVLDTYYGCGNSLIRRARMPDTEPFSTAMNELGGEDDKLFASLKAGGAAIAWAADAPVWEDVPPQRATLTYTLRRGFAYGQGPAYWAGMEKRWVACIGWMIQGAGQAVVFAGMGAVARLVGSPHAAHLFDKAARGLGKVLWFPPFKLKFYGQALLKKDSQRPSAQGHIA
ncbi:glycosyl transferase family 2 family protein [Asticcacaulis biprosthecium C19]|uniref:Glycosyl transferase family 2 family protein n=1 Tax=Asticcacaulis biprosthecium C19 TaxID=715226 RepID=F4QGN1_9CAUL|nr:glycosyl transferase family 2 family protein [Asticcacaulis biprosthecium C19]